jgi:xanthine dehydrogenase small subunit
VLNAVVTLIGPDGRREIDLNAFYTGYRQSKLRPNELIASIDLPLPAAGEVFKLYKVSNRADMDISTVSAAVWMKRSGAVIDEVRIALGGVGPTTLRLPKTEAFLTGRQLDQETADGAAESVLSEITPITDVRGSAAYRNHLAANLLRRLHAELALPVIHNGNGRHH